MSEFDLESKENLCPLQETVDNKAPDYVGETKLLLEISLTNAPNLLDFTDTIGLAGRIVETTGPTLLESTSAIGRQLESLRCELDKEVMSKEFLQDELTTAKEELENLVEEKALSDRQHEALSAEILSMTNSDKSKHFDIELNQAIRELEQTKLDLTAALSRIQEENTRQFGELQLLSIKEQNLIDHNRLLIAEAKVTSQAQKDLETKTYRERESHNTEAALLTSARLILLKENRRLKDSLILASEDFTQRIKTLNHKHSEDLQEQALYFQQIQNQVEAKVALDRKEVQNERAIAEKILSAALAEKDEALLAGQFLADQSSRLALEKEMFLSATVSLGPRRARMSLICCALCFMVGLISYSLVLRALDYVKLI